MLFTFITKFSNHNVTDIIKLLMNKIIGCNNVLVATLPVYTRSVKSKGIKTFINPTKLFAVSFTILIISVKFDIINVTINIY